MTNNKEIRGTGRSARCLLFLYIQKQTGKLPYKLGCQDDDRREKACYTKIEVYYGENAKDPEGHFRVKDNIPLKELIC